MAEEHGTELIQKLLFLIGDTVMSVEDAKSDDGKIDWAEWAGIGVDVVPEVISLMASSSELKAQFNEWSPAERQANLAAFKARFDLDDDRAEKIAEALLTAAVYLAEGIGQFVNVDPVE